VTSSYSGSDPATAAQFQGQGNGIPGTRTDYIEITGTNASTQTYKELTSLQEAEPVPVGLAKKIYDGLSQLHYEGTFELTEDECSGYIPLGAKFNTIDGRDEWKTMDALVLRVVENIDDGKTEVTFGPPITLTAGDYVELLRAQRGRLFSTRLNQRTTGDAGSSNVVIGHLHSPVSSVTSPAAGAYSPSDPFAITSRIDPVSKAKQIKVQLKSTLYKSPSKGDNIALTGLDTWITVDGVGYVYLKGNVVNYEVSGNPSVLTCAQSGGEFDPNALPWNAGAVVEASAGGTPTQICFRTRIGDFDATGAAAPVVTQILKSNLILTNCPPGGLPAVYPLPLT